MELVLACLSLAAVAGCTFDGTYADASNEYSVACNAPGSGTVHLAIVLGDASWQPLNATLTSPSTMVAPFNNSAAGPLTGTIGASRISWSNGAVWERAVPAASVKKVHLVYMTHLDLGFTNTTRGVCDTYFDDYFPKAFATAAALRARAGPERFRWTEFTWLIQEYLDGGAGCAHRDRTPAELAAMEAAIAAGDVIWHATAVNFLPEVLDERAWAYSFGLRDDLNARFNKSWGFTGKHTDTPGMSKGAIPALLAAGVGAYHIGYNSACAKNVATLPPAFRWRSPANASEELFTFVNDNYGSQILVQETDAVAPADAAEGGSGDGGKTLLYRHGIAGAEDVALVFQFTGDNGGLPDADAVVKYWASLQAKFPAATIVASSMDDFSREVIAKADMSKLPVIEGEIGDSWLYGAPADPIKVATYREAVRALEEGVASGAIDPATDGGYKRFQRRLMKGPCEHNWGWFIDHGSWATDWDNGAFAKRRRTDADWAKHELEWAAQREWMHPCTQETASSLPLTCDAANAAAAAGGKGWDAFVAGLEKRLAPLMAPATALPGAAAVAASAEPLTPAELDAMAPLQCGDHARVAFSGADGSIRFLATTAPQPGGAGGITEDEWETTAPQPGGAGAARTWVGGGAGTLAAFSYRSYSNADFSETFAAEYTTSGDFMKQGMDSAKPEARSWAPALRRGFIQATAQGCVAVMELGMAEAEAHDAYGAPGNVTLQFTLPGADGALADVALLWTNKTATRLAESSWLSFAPISTDAEEAAWEMDIMGHAVSPLEVVPGGTKHVHVVSGGATFRANGTAGAGATMRVQPLDTPLLSPGDTAHLLRYNDEQPDAVRGGMHFNLHNNLWGTAFPQWYGDDGLARFKIFATD